MTTTKQPPDACGSGLFCCLLNNERMLLFFFVSCKSQYKYIYSTVGGVVTVPGIYVRNIALVGSLRNGVNFAFFSLFQMNYHKKCHHTTLRQRAQDAGAFALPVPDQPLSSSPPLSRPAVCVSLSAQQDTKTETLFFFSCTP